MVTVAGWITRITTVHTKRWDHRPPDRSISSRKPTAVDRMALATVLDVAPRPQHHSAGPCGTDVRASRVAGAWGLALADLCRYLEHWGHVPLSDEQRMSPGPKAGPRGRAAAA